MSNLDNYPPLPLKRPVSKSARVAGILVGLFAVLMSTLLYLGMRTLVEELDPPEVLWAYLAISLTFSLIGLIIVVRCLQGLLHDWRLRRKRVYESEPWMRDHPWDRRCTHNRLSRGLMSGFLKFSFVALIIAPFNYMAWEAFGDGILAGLFVTAIVLVFDILLLIWLWTLFYQVFQLIKYGRTTIWFQTFPFFLGDELDVQFTPPPQLHGLNDLVCTLRCLTNRTTEAQNSGQNIPTVCKQLWSKEQKIESLYVGRQIDIRFKLPSDQLESALAKRPPTYWELELRAKTSGIDYQAIFTVPIYKNKPKEGVGHLERADPRMIELQEGEEIRWAGRGNPDLRGILPLFLVSAFGIPFTAFSVFWMGAAVKMFCETIGEFKGEQLLIFGMPLFMIPLIGLLFVLVGLGMLMLPFWVHWATKREMYAVTDRRVLHIGGMMGKKVQVLEPEQVGSMTVRKRGDGLGDICFGRGRPTMCGVNQVGKVVKMIRELAREPGISEVPQGKEP